ncbi:NXPE family member 1-like isoform X1 [Lissotriton helveticus]
MKYAKVLVVLLVGFTLLSFLVQKNFVKLPNFMHLAGRGNCTTQQAKEFENPEQLTEMRVTEIINKLEQLIPSVTFTHVGNSTCAMKTSVKLINPLEKYCSGDNLTIQLDMHDCLGNRKVHGGDFLRARIYTPALGAGASGKITDLKNGSYLVDFTLFWAGQVEVSLLLIHPSEAVSGLWRARNSGYDNIEFVGTFANGTHNAQTACNFASKKDKGICLHLGKEGEVFYCIKPEHLPCDTLIRMQSFNTKHSYLSTVEQQLLTRSNTGVEIPKPFQYIDVFDCKKRDQSLMKTCRTGMHSPFPSGYFIGNKWHPVFCNIIAFNNSEEKRNCLAGKMVFLMGDSTLRQWILHCTAVIKTLKYFNLHRTGLETKLLALDMERNILVQWKRHGYPYIASAHYSVKDVSYIAHDIDQLSGGGHFVIIINLGQHFRPFPIEVFIRRAMDVRFAVERLLLRSPDTKVIIKAENTREMNINQERFSDFHGYIQYLVVKEVFDGLNVGVVDAWDMTTAFATDNVHPPETVVMNQVDMFLTYIS